MMTTPLSPTHAKVSTMILKLIMVTASGSRLVLSVTTKLRGER